MQKLNEIRKGGQVKRYHTVPMLNNDSVAQHSWGVAVILLDIKPNASAELIKAALYHDVTEYYTGDVPATTKWANPGIKKQLDELETMYEQVLDIRVPLAGNERQLVKYADMADLVLNCLHEYKMGNRYAKVLIERGMGKLSETTNPLCAVYHIEFEKYVREEMKNV